MPVVSRDPKVTELSLKIIDEILIAVGLPANSWLRKLLEPILWKPAERFSTLAVHFDQTVGKAGLCAGARLLLPEFLCGFTEKGAEQVPSTGPLLVASNHPGAYDALVIAANLQRDDLKCVISGVPFSKALPHAAKEFIFATPNPHERMAATRACIHHLQSGGALLIFPSGIVDPDPAILPGADQALNRWSRSLEIMLRNAPQTRLVPVIVGGVLDPAFFKNPLTRLRKDWEQRKLAEVIQILQQMIFSRKFGQMPRVVFGKPLSPAELTMDSRTTGLLDAIILNARQVLWDWPEII